MICNWKTSLCVIKLLFSKDHSVGHISVLLTVFSGCSFQSNWANWENALEIIQPDTVKRWCRQGVRFNYPWRPRRNLGGRPLVDKEIRDLIKRMARDNFLWGAPRIYGELLKLGYKNKVSQASVSRYLKRDFPKPRYLTWCAFLKNQLIGIEEFYPSGIFSHSIKNISGFLILFWKQSRLMLWKLLTIPVSRSRKFSEQISEVTSLPNSIDRIDQFHGNITCQRVPIILIRGSPSDKIVKTTFFSNSSQAHISLVKNSSYALIWPNLNFPPIKQLFPQFCYIAFCQQDCS